MVHPIDKSGPPRSLSRSRTAAQQRQRAEWDNILAQYGSNAPTNTQPQQTESAPNETAASPPAPNPSPDETNVTPDLKTFTPEADAQPKQEAHAMLTVLRNSWALLLGIMLLMLGNE